MKDQSAVRGRAGTWASLDSPHCRLHQKKHHPCRKRGGKGNCVLSALWQRPNPVCTAAAGRGAWDALVWPSSRSQALIQYQIFDSAPSLREWGEVGMSFGFFIFLRNLYCLMDQLLVLLLFVLSLLQEGRDLEAGRTKYFY